MILNSRTSKLSGGAVYGVVMTTSTSSTSSTGSRKSWQDPATVEWMLDEAHTWAVVGLSGDPSRTAYSIASLLQRRGKRIVPIHPVFADPGAPAVLGEQGYATLADVPFAIDVVDVFRRSSAAGEFADQAVEVGAGGVWFQLGVVDADAFDRTTAAGVPMVMDTCPAIEWRRRGR
jgi:predicted CoA-binding protein